MDKSNIGGANFRRLITVGAVGSGVPLCEIAAQLTPYFERPKYQLSCP